MRFTKMAKRVDLDLILDQFDAITQQALQCEQDLADEAAALEEQLVEVEKKQSRLKRLLNTLNNTVEQE